MKLEGAYIRNILHMICAKEKETEIKPLKIKIPYYQRPYEWGGKANHKLNPRF